MKILGKKIGSWGGFGKSFGSALNDWLGVSNSAKQQYENQLKLQHDAQDFSKWQMANAHQMEVQDLNDAGLNAVLSANGGAGAGVSQGSASAGVTGTDPISMANAIIGMINSSKQTNAIVDKTNADIQNETNKTNAEVNKALKEAGYTQKQIEYYNKHGVFPGATITKAQGGKFFGLGGTESETIPVGFNGNKKPKRIDKINSAKQKYGNTSKEFWYQ